MTRLAKNILQEVVGKWLDRDREAVETLQQIRGLAVEMTEAVARKDLAEFGRLIDVAWRLNKRLDPNSTTAEIEALLETIRPHLFGAKLLGAGGGGFLLMVCRSAADAQRDPRAVGSAAAESTGQVLRFFAQPRGTGGERLLGEGGRRKAEGGRRKTWQADRVQADGVQADGVQADGVPGTDSVIRSWHLIHAAGTLSTPGVDLCRMPPMSLSAARRTRFTRKRAAVCEARDQHGHACHERAQRGEAADDDPEPGANGAGEVRILLDCA